MKANGLKKLELVTGIEYSIDWDIVIADSIDEVSKTWHDIPQGNFLLTEQRIDDNQIYCNWVEQSTKDEIDLEYNSNLSDSTSVTIYETHKDNYIEFLFNTTVHAINFINSNWTVGRAKFVPEPFVLPKL